MARYNLSFCLLHEQAVTTRPTCWPSTWPAAIRRRSVAQGDRDRHAGAGRGVQHLYRHRPDERHRSRGRDGPLHRRDLARPRGGGRRAAEPRPDLPRPRASIDQAIAAFGGIRRKSPRWLEAQTRLGGAHWAKQPRPRAEGRHQGRRRRDPEGRRDPAERAEGAARGWRRGHRPRAGRQRRRSGRSCSPSPARRRTPSSSSTRSSRPRRSSTGTAYSRLMEAQLMAFIGTNQVQQAIGDDEGAGAGRRRREPHPALPQARPAPPAASSTRSSRRGTAGRYQQMHQSYKTFLTTLAGAKSGQTYESLQWAGREPARPRGLHRGGGGPASRPEGLSQDPQFLQQPNGEDEPASAPGSSWRRPCAARQVRRGQRARRGACSRSIPSTSSPRSRRGCCWKPRPRPRPAR